MDFSVKDIVTHTRPYSFDNLTFDNAGRLKPVYSEIFTRSTLIRQGGSLDIYSAWFKNQLNLWPKRIFSIGGGNNIFENGDIELNLRISTQANSKNTDLIFKADRVNQDSALFSKRGEGALLAALKKPEYAQNIKQELNSLLFPGKKSVTDHELEIAIKEISCKKASYE
jgi:hypothetical protein